VEAPARVDGHEAARARDRARRDPRARSDDLRRIRAARRREANGPVGLVWPQGTRRALDVAVDDRRADGPQSPRGTKVYDLRERVLAEARVAVPYDAALPTFDEQLRHFTERTVARSASPPRAGSAIIPAPRAREQASVEPATPCSSGSPMTASCCARRSKGSMRRRICHRDAHWRARVGGDGDAHHVTLAVRFAHLGPRARESDVRLHGELRGVRRA